MTQTMIKKIDSVLDRVIEKESNLPLSHLGLVERVRYNERQNKLYVFTKAVHSTHGCCTLLALVQQSDTLNQLEEQFKQEFPEHWIQIVNV
jgi:metal-sulfur cluster biosynthetic enzyme